MLEKIKYGFSTLFLINKAEVILTRIGRGVNSLKLIVPVTPVLYYI